MKRTILFNPLNYGEVFGQWDDLVFDEEAADSEARNHRDRIATVFREGGMEVATFELPNKDQTRSIFGSRAYFTVTLYGLEYDCDL